MVYNWAPIICVFVFCVVFMWMYLCLAPTNDETQTFPPLPVAVLFANAVVPAPEDTRTKKALEALPVRRHKSLVEQFATRRMSVAHECAVCLMDFAAEDDIRVLPCQHCFHKQCVDHWFESSRHKHGVSKAPQCPLCKQNPVELTSKKGMSTATCQVHPQPSSPQLPGRVLSAAASTLANECPIIMRL